jgi:hypothetical protein
MAADPDQKMQPQDRLVVDCSQTAQNGSLVLLDTNPSY